jgi:hypothetical protein
VVNVKKGVRLTEFKFCGEKSLHMVYALAAKIEICQPDPNTWNADAREDTLGACLLRFLQSLGAKGIFGSGFELPTHR